MPDSDRSPPLQPAAGETPYRTGFVTIVGRPNVGKSTLLNRLVGEKVSIVSRKAQTTRNRITGILSTDKAQFVFVDTPGFQTEHRSVLNSAMNDTVRHALEGVDVVLFVLEADRLGPADEKVLHLLPKDIPVIAVLNKIDLVADKSRLFAFAEKLQVSFPFAALVPVSAERGLQTDILLGEIESRLPLAPPMFEEDMFTDRGERFLAAEMIREKAFRLLGDEIPYALAVEIEKYEHEGKLRRIYAAILVDKASQKGIVIGKGGERAKRIGTEARQDMEALFGGKVHLELWVRVRSGWADDERAVQSLGYRE